MLPFKSSPLRRIVAAAAAWRRRQRDRHQMMAMSEAELRDLGIGRGQIPALLEAPPRPSAPWQAFHGSEAQAKPGWRRTNACHPQRG